MRGFAEIPAHISARVAGGEPVLLIMLDGFGMVFLERHLEHPLVKRLSIAPLRSQFPSTTTAHVTTLHFGLPVEDHGLYEWSVYEPSLDAIISPLPFRLAGDDGREGLAGTLDPRRLLDVPTFYEGLGVPAEVVQPVGLEASSYSRLAGVGARLVGSDDLAGSVRSLVSALADGRIGYGHIYWPEIDTTSHLHGPDAPEVTAAILHALNAIESALAAAPPGLTVLITADHGHTAVSPDRIDHLDVIWPGLAGHLSQPRPAGSPRDVFLHVRPESATEVIDELSDRLAGRAVIQPAADLFADIGPRLAARLGDVAVLPVPGRSAWFSGLATPASTHFGSHGGLSAAETATHLSELRT